MTATSPFPATFEFLECNKKGNTNYNTLLAEVKLNLDQKMVAALLDYLGYEVDRSYKFRMRSDDRTPSASIDKNGRIKDFGSGWRGDIFDLLMAYHGKSFREAIEWVAECLGVR